MRIIKIISIAILFCCFNCAKNEKQILEGQYRINGSAIGLDKGKIYLRNYPDVDTIKVENGKFIIENTIKEPVYRLSLIKDVSIMEMNEQTSISFFVEPKIMDLELNYSDFSKSKLTGSETQDDHKKLVGIRDKIAENYKKERDDFEKLSQKYRDAVASGASEEELELIKYEDNDARDKLGPMWGKQNEATVKFIKENPKSYISMFNLMFLLGDMQYGEAKPLYDSFDSKYTNTERGKNLFAAIENMKKGIPGAIAGSFNTTDINGNSIQLADFKDNYLLIDFWASWCVPCRKGNPHLISLYEKYHSKGLEILGVSDDDRAHDKWKKAVKNDGIGIWHHVLRGLEYKEGTYERTNIEKDISESYNISSLPTKILINPDGIIIGRYGGGGEDDEAMDEKLATLFDK